MEKERDNVAITILLLRIVDHHFTPNGDRIAGPVEAANLWPKCRI